MNSQKTTLLLFLFFVLLKNSTAQVAGGTYTVGGASPNYANLQSLDTALQSGISGPVVFNIRPGIYPGKLNIGTITGSSAVNTVIFKAENGDSTSVVITDSSSTSNNSNFTIFISAATYVTFRNLTIQRPGINNYATVLYIGANCRFLQVRNCIIQSGKTNGTNDNSSLVSLPLGTPNDSSITFSKCVFNNGYYALRIIGQSSTLLIPLTNISDNIFNNQTGGGIQLSFASAPVINGNVITTNAAAFGYHGISLRRLQNNYLIQKNKVTGQAQGQALYMDTCSSTSGLEGLVANNFLQTQGSGTASGMYISQCSGIHFYFNTVHVATTGNNNAAFRLNNSGNSFLTVKNNVLVNSGGGYSYYVPAGGLGNFISSDYNDLYVGANSPALAYVDTGAAANLTLWQSASGLDANSVSGDPQFVSIIDLHAGSTVINNIATPIAGISTDIDGDPRSLTTPDIGADEFSPLSNNLGALAFASPASGECGDSSTVFGIVIRNFGLSTQSGFDVKADLTGSITQLLTETYSGSLVGNAIDTIYFSQTLNTFQGASINVKAYTSLAGDQFSLNDTIEQTFSFGGHPNAPVVVSPQQQCDNNVHITAAVDSGNVLEWFDQPVGGNLLHIGQDFSPVISGDTVFYVEARTGSGTSGCLRITEIDLSYDYIEIQNLSGTNFDATGWQVIASDDYANINLIADSTWKLGTFNANQVQYKSDLSTDNYWGNNLNWEPGIGNPGWAMIIDNNYNVVDFLSWSWNNLAIDTFNVIVDGHSITLGSEWSGAGKTTCATTAENLQRFGSVDHNDSTDFSCESPSKGIQNTNIQSVFINCGIGACPSERLPVNITLVPGITTNLGNDTIVPSTFTITLDAGAGFTSYLWSTGDTTQTLMVDSIATYWVTVTGGPNNCSFTDSINILLNVGTGNVIGDDEFSIYPNPASDKIIITGNSNVLKSAIIRVTDLQGRIVKLQTLKLSSNQAILELNNLNEGVYFLQIISGDRAGVRKFSVMR